MAMLHKRSVMSKTRNNHYVPQWYQEGFLEVGLNTLAYLDMTPSQKTLGDGRVITYRAKFDASTSRAFRQRDLYSTFFGTSVNDEIERRLFGDIDARGSNAVRAFTRSDVSEWHRHFQTLFEYIDIQRIRTPKGLDWLKAQYPTLTQNELMLEMQGIRMMHCTIWSEGVREIVSAEDADVKFLVSDHPVTIYNHAAPPEAQACAYAAPRPARIAVVDGGAWAVALGQVAPRGAGAQNIENSVQNPPIVHTLRTTSALGQKRLDHRPFFV